MKTRHDDLISALLAECSDMILAGASLAACLERYPEQASELEPLLSTIFSVHELTPVPPRLPAVAARGRTIFMSQVARLQPRGATRSWWQSFVNPFPSTPRTRPLGLFAILLIVIISGIVISGSVTLASSALPGDFLFGVKTGAENVRMFLTTDEEAREDLSALYGQRRVDEARAVVDRRRPVDNLILQGIIESLGPDRWVVSGLEVLLQADTKIEGTPVIGATVRGRMQAPGDGTLRLIYAEVFPTESAGAGAPGVIATETPTARPPTSTPTSSPTMTPTAVLAAPLLPLQGMTPAEPTDQPTATSTPTSTPTRTATPTPTRTATPSLTPTPTQTRTPTATLRPPQEVLKGRVTGRLTAMNGSVWTINGENIEVTASTSVSGTPEIGAMVDAEVQLRSGAMPLALSITVTAPPEATPEPYEFQDYVEAIDPPWWTIGGHRVRVTGDTQLIDSPGIGDLARVKALRQASGELWATSIEAIRIVEVQIDGIIEAVSADSIRVDGRTIAINSQTQFVGSPAVGLQAQVRALQMPDGSLIATIVVVVEPAETSTAEPTATPTVAPAESATAEPSATPTFEPTDPAPSEPTPTPAP